MAEEKLAEKTPVEPDAVISARAVVALVACLWLLGVGALAVVGLRDWSSGESEIPTLALFLLLGVFLLASSASLAALAAVKLKIRSAWLLLVGAIIPLGFAVRACGTF